jgi:hypothetical protein
LPVTYTFNEQTLRYQKKAVVCAYGAHINRLYAAVHAEWLRQHPVQEEVFA